jgi:hypothetical protein
MQTVGQTVIEVEVDTDFKKKFEDAIAPVGVSEAIRAFMAGTLKGDFEGLRVSRDVAKRAEKAMREYGKSVLVEDVDKFMDSL